MPLRAFLAGLLTVVTFKIPGSVNSPTARFLMLRSISESMPSMTEPTCFLVRPVHSAKLVTIWPLVIFCVIGAADFFTGAAFLAAVFLAGDFFAAFFGAFLAAFFI